MGHVAIAGVGTSSTSVFRFVWTREGRRRFESDAPWRSNVIFHAWSDRPSMPRPRTHSPVLFPLRQTAVTSRRASAASMIFRPAIIDLRCANLPARAPAVIPASLMGHVAREARALCRNRGRAPSHHRRRIVDRRAGTLRAAKATYRQGRATRTWRSHAVRLCEVRDLRWRSFRRVPEVGLEYREGLSL